MAGRPPATGPGGRPARAGRREPGDAGRRVPGRPDSAGRPVPGRPASAGPSRPAWSPAALARNTLLWLLPVAVVWVLLTPFYNRLLLRCGEQLLHLAEHPAVTALPPRGAHDAYVQRLDFPPAKSLVYGFRVTDLHFPLVLLGALFLGVPGVPWRERLRNLGLALLATLAFDLVLVVFYVKACYAAQLGAWSLAHYGPVARNLYAQGKHLLDLPFKLALPLLLWCAFYLPRLLAARRPPADPADRRSRQPPPNLVP
jgi:hypothetical protein